MRSESADHPTETSNLGLGLFIAREIAKSHRGSIEVRSDEVSTIFTVHLPTEFKSGVRKFVNTAYRA
jgi:nitrogen-specific signal transduction histidine kinase